MKLRKYSLIGGLILSAIIFLSHLYISNFVIQSGFTEIERQYILRNLNSVRHEIRNRTLQLDTFVWDWASWDDTYSFAQEKNSQYIDSNLRKATFTDQGLSAIIIRNTEGKIVYARALSEDGENDPALLQGFLSILEGDIPLLKDEDSGRGGVARIGMNFYFLAIRPILTTEGKGPSVGTIAMTRPITEDTIADISASLGIPVVLRPLEKAPSMADTLTNSPTGRMIIEIDDSSALAASLLQTLGGSNTGLITVTLDRKITLYGQQVKNYNTVIIAAAILIFAVLAYLLLHFRLLKRLERLQTQVAACNYDGEGRLLVDVDGTDEIGDLATSINNLLGEIARSHREKLAQAEEIADNERFLTQVMDSISVGVLLVDPETRKIKAINNHALKLAGRTREEVLGKVCHRLTCPAEMDNCPILDQHQSHDLSKRKLLTKDGNSIPIMKSVCFLEKKGNRYLLETIIDITEIEQSRLELEQIKDGLEEIVAERTRDLAEANNELIALDKAKTLFLSSASHELRTPLTSILGFLKLMERRFDKDFLPILSEDENNGPKADKFMQNLNVVRSEAERLGRLVNDLLDLNKIQSGRMEWRDELLPIQDLLDRASEAFEGRAASKPELEFLVDRAPENLTVLADKDRIQQVLINLLDNAFKFTERGHVRISVEAVGNLAAIRVCDTGKGIANEDREQIFDLFYQVRDENQRSSKEFGTGLGLAICRQIVTHYGGDISVASKEGGGTCFLFTIPRADSELI